MRSDMMILGARRAYNNRWRAIIQIFTFGFYGSLNEKKFHIFISDFKKEKKQQQQSDTHGLVAQLAHESKQPHLPTWAGVVAGGWLGPGATMICVLDSQTNLGCLNIIQIFS